MTSIHIANLVQIFGYGLFAFMMAILVFPYFIKQVQAYKLTQKIRSEDISGKAAKLFAKLHAHKSGTPTMGGVVIIGSVVATVLLSRLLAYFGVVEHSLLNRGETYLPLATLVGVGILGMIDDYLNITEKSAQKGLSARVKMWTLLGFAIAGALWFVFRLEWSILHIPALGDFDIGLWYARKSHRRT